MSFLKHPRFWLACLLAGTALAALPLFIRTPEAGLESKLRKVRGGMTQDEVIAVLGPPNGDGSRALLWRDGSLLRKRKDRLWVHFNGGHIQQGESDKRSLIERIRHLWQGSQDGYESYERSPEF
jgi:hypothetical protein